MKVPTYDRQVGETADTGSRNLTAQISPSNMAAPFQATAQLGSDIAKAGLQWYGHDLKLKRNNEEAAAVIELRKQSSALKNKILYGDLQKGVAPVSPEIQKETYDVEIKKIQANIASKMSDKVAMKRFGSSSLNTILTDSLDVQKNSRLQTVDRAKALFNEEIFILKRTLQQNQSNPKGIEYKQAYEKLYGSIAYQKLYGVSSGNEIPSMFERGQILGVIDATDAQKLKRTSLEDLDESSVNDFLRLAQTEEEFENLEAKIVSGEYKNLSTSSQDRLLNRVTNKKLAFIKSENRKDAKEIELNKKIRKEKQDKNFSRIDSAIRKYNLDGEFPEGQEVNEFEIINLIESRDLSASGGELLLKRLKREDAEQTNPYYYALAQEVVRDPNMTKEDLIAMRQEIYNNTGRRGMIKLTDADRLSNLIDKRLDDSYDSREEERIREELDTYIDNNFRKENITKFKFNPMLKDRFEELLEQENPLTNKNYTPFEAAKAVKDLARSFIKERVIPLPPVVQSEEFRALLKEPGLNKLTIEDIEKEKTRAMNSNQSVDVIERRIQKLNEMIEYFRTRED
tara:strand:- start:854 stop:2560 length:1707 start_codon:yes stop_codon:yes gene_type:complete